MSDVKQSEKISHTSLQNGSDAGAGQQNNDNKKSVWEWVTGAIGLVLVFAAIGFVLYQAIWGKEMPPDARLSVESVQPVSGGYLVKFELYNQSSATMAGVVISADLKSGTEKIESSQTTVNFLPSNSTRKGGFFFRKNPNAYTLETRVLGYQQP